MRARALTVPLAVVAFATGVTVVACEPTLEQETGIVVDINAPTFGRVDDFELLTLDGERLTFDTTELAFRPEFPAPHLAEHRALGDRIVVTYKRDGERLVATQLDDATP